MTRFDESDVGCWLDGRFAERTHVRAINLAMRNGMVVEGVDLYDYIAYDSGNREDVIVESIEGQGGLVDKATEYLQQVTDNGLVWEWEAGDLILRREED